MDILFSDKRYLTPRLLDAGGAGCRRVAGVLEAGARTAAVYVDAIDYDGQRCRYRVDGAAPPASERWLSEDEAGEYHPFSRLIIERLRAVAVTDRPTLRRFPGGPPSRALARRLARLDGRRTLSVVDTCVSADGRLWLRAEFRAGPARAVASTAAEPVDAWLALADASAVLGEVRAEPAAPPQDRRAAARTAA